MATKVLMEALSPTMEEGRLVKWLKAEGDAVKNGDTLAEVETDKAIMELAARGEGVLRKQLIAEGGTAPVGSLIGVIAAPDEDIAALVQQAGGAAAAPAAPAEATAATSGGPPPSRESTAQPPPEPHPSTAPTSVSTQAPPRPAARAPSAPPAPAAPRAPAPTDSNDRPRSSPLARRLASARGVDLRAIEGSGPGGRIIKRDVESAPAAAATPAAAQAPARAAIRPLDGADYRDVPLTQIRKTIARRLAESIGPIPTFYLTAEFDMERMAEMRTAMTELGDEFKVSFNDIVLKAVATALAQHPECNAHWQVDHIRYFSRVHLGMAVAVEDGLITPVLFDADRKGLRDIAREARDLADRARERRLKPDEYTGATFSVSNLGMFGIDDFTAIINPPEAGILAVGAIEPKPVVHDGTVTVRRRMRVTMSCDHRVIDGATGAVFLRTLRRIIENPLMLVY
ncbi:MAG TPA: pyruvate dehydrogenase complex dihydrolipoamide acetyltransferase [Gemmatimonadaceae bacterium]|nr:pyruvate dehydrogenase complex dihydrolipoamide acetyltransferase [Gemmatimonadaceae bacterium]